jgi:hypothetical protein
MANTTCHVGVNEFMIAQSSGQQRLIEGVTWIVNSAISHELMAAAWSTVRIAQYK